MHIIYFCIHVYLNNNFTCILLVLIPHNVLLNESILFVKFRKSVPYLFGYKTGFPSLELPLFKSVL